MSFFNLIILIILLIVINSLITKGIKKLENKVDGNEEYYESNKLSFKRLAKKYIENLGYGDFIEDNIENITIYEDSKITLIWCKDLSKENTRKSKNYIMEFISNMVLKSASEGIFIYNGELPQDIAEVIKENKNFNFNIEFINEEKILSSISKNVLK